MLLLKRNSIACTILPWTSRSEVHDGVFHCFFQDANFCLEFWKACKRWVKCFRALHAGCWPRSSCSCWPETRVAQEFDWNSPSSDSGILLRNVIWRSFVIDKTLSDFNSCDWVLSMPIRVSTDSLISDWFPTTRRDEQTKVAVYQVTRTG